MPGSQLRVQLYRDSFNTPWGFRLQGGKDLNQPLTVQRVFSNSPAEGELQRGDVILAIGGQDTHNFTHKGAQDTIKSSGGQIQLIVNRPPPGSVHISPLSPPIHTQRPRAPSLQDHSPHRPKQIQYASPSQHKQNPTNNYTNYHQTPKSRNPQTNMSARRHNQPIHVHIEPSRPTSQTNYYIHATPSPQHQNNPGFYQNASSSPYATLPRRQRGFSQPPYQSPTTPTIPPPPWATQQASPKKVSKLSMIGGGEPSMGTSFKSSTLPRRGNYQSTAQHQVRRRPDQDENDEPDLFEEKRPTGPPPKVCSLSNLGGGAIDFSSGSHESHTLPRRNIQRRLSQPPSMPSRSPYGIYVPPKQSVTTGQRIEPGTHNGVMLNRVQSTLDNITLSPRTPDTLQQNPWAKQQQPSEPQFFTPTSILLDQQQKAQEEERQRQQQHQRNYPPQPQYHQHPKMVVQPQMYQPQPDDPEEEGEEPVVPVWERRKQFQEAPKPRQKSQAAVRTPKTNPVPTVSRPAPGSNQYANVGLSYKNTPTQQSNATWQPAPAQAPPPQVVNYSSSPVKQVQSPVKSGPPSWARPQGNDEDEEDGSPWRNTLRTTGVKPWDVDLDYMQDAQNNDPQRSPAQAQANQGQGGQGLPGGRDWSQSQVFQFLQKDTRKSGPKVKPAPATAPKPQQQKPQQRQQQQYHQPPAQRQQPVPQQYQGDIGISDF